MTACVGFWPVNRPAKRFSLKTASDPNVWSGRAVQEDFDDQQMRSCINVSGLCLERSTPGHHGYQRACELISGQASTGPFGSPVFACAGKTDPPFRLIVSQTSAGKGVVTSSMAPHFALLLCSCLAVVPSSRPARADAPRARGRQGPAVVLPRRLALPAARPRLDGPPEHGARIKQVGTKSPPSGRTRRRVPC